MNLDGRSPDVSALLTKLGYDHQGNARVAFSLVERLRAGDPDLYRTIRLAKRDGGVRVVFAPCQELKTAQRKIHVRLLLREKSHRCCTSYLRKRGPVDAARKLVGNHAMLRMDLKDFFPSITEPRVAGLFRKITKDDAWGGEKSVHTLATLCCYQKHLCQGAPSSPVISNLIFHACDDHLARLASGWNLTYIRYCDDLFFFGPENFNAPKLRDAITRVVMDNGFAINSAKTKYFTTDQPRILLGLNTHGTRLTIPKATRRRYRAAFHRAALSPAECRDMTATLSGYAGRYRQVYGRDGNYRVYARIVKELKVSDRWLSILRFLRRLGILRPLRPR